MSDPGSSPQIRMSRRQLATLSAIGGLAGGLWTVGFAALSRASNPDLTVVGDDAWQVALLEVGADRVLICAGLFEESANPAARRLLTTFRQHVDVIVATESALRQLDRNGALAASVVVQLDAPSNQSDTPTVRALRHYTSITVTDGLLQLERIPQSEWSQTSPAEASWWIRLELRGLTIVMTPDLQTAASVAPPETTMVLAPEGNAVTLLRTLPGAAIATNGNRWKGGSEQHVAESTFLIRTFPNDPARFRFNGGSLVLPKWAEELPPASQNS